MTRTQGRQKGVLGAGVNLILACWEYLDCGAVSENRGGSIGEGSKEGKSLVIVKSVPD